MGFVSFAYVDVPIFNASDGRWSVIGFLIILRRVYELSIFYKFLGLIN